MFSGVHLFCVRRTISSCSILKCDHDFYFVLFFVCVFVILFLCLCGCGVFVFLDNLVTDKCSSVKGKLTVICIINPFSRLD